MINDIKAAFSELKIECSEEQINQFVIYKELLVEWNEHVNLTAITDDKGIAVKHFADSISPLNFFDIKDKSIIDVGTGAGFPGIPFKIIEPSAKLTLLDSLNKRINFLKEVCDELNLNDVTLIHGRAEEVGVDKKHREKYDIATSRAVANLPVLLEYCLPFLKVGGTFICLKGPKALEEIEQSKKALDVLGGKINKIEEVILEDDEEIKHYILFIDKVKNIPTIYPRKAGTPAKKPII